MWKIATSIGTIGVLLCMLAGAGLAQPGRRDNGHPGGGGGPHPGGGGPALHVGGPRLGGGGPHFGAAVPHYRVGRAGPGPAVRFGGPRIGHFASPHIAHIRRPSLHASRPRFAGHVARFAGVKATSGINLRNFTAHRRSVASGGFNRFVDRDWRRHHHLGWVGPLFWPYAYGDFFYYALWPDEYDYIDPFWAYGYDDLYAGIFSPYSYADYVQGPGAPARMTALTQSMAKSCAAETAEVTGWPIDQIRAAVQPNPQQASLLDDLGKAIAQASDVITSHCPSNVSFTPTGRLDAMQQRLQALIQAANLVGPPLAQFYDSLSDEQKARFNAMGAPAKPTAGSQPAASTQSPPVECGAAVVAWPKDQINRVVQPTAAQSTKLDVLQAATAKAADIIKAVCPTEMPSTPPSRLDAVVKRLQAMLQAVATVQPPLQDFYDSLNDDQKARFDTIGRQIFAANHG